MSGGPLLDVDTIRAAFTMLGDELARRSVAADVYVFGGAAVVLAFDADQPTRDIDAKILSHHGQVSDAAAVVARRLGLPRGWLNEQATVYLPRELVAGRAPVFDHPNLRVLSAPPELLLAMKLRRAHERDIPHIRMLLDHLEIDDADAALHVVAVWFPEDPAPAAHARMLLDDVLGHGAGFHHVEQGNAQIVGAAAAAARRAPHRRACGKAVKATGLPCLLARGHRGRCRSR